MLKLKWETNFKDADFGQIPLDWEERKLRQVIKFLKKGKVPNMENRGGRIYPYLSVGYLRGEEEPSQFYSEKAGILVEHGDILVIWDGAANAGEILKAKKGILGSTLTFLEVIEECDKDFLFAALKLQEEEIKSLRSGTDDRHVDKEAFLEFEIPFPKTSEQVRIATVVDYFDHLIENKKRQNEVLEEVAMAVFKSWFVDFEPFRDGEFVSSELGEIPKGWEVKPIGELAEIRNGLSYSGKEKFEEQVEGSYIFITLNNAIEGGGFKPVYAWIKSDRIKEHHFLEEGDLIIPNTEQTKDERLLGSPGIVFFPPDYEGKKGVYSHHITKIRPFEPKHKLFLHLFLRFTREDSASFATGTGVLGMNIDNFKKNKLVIVPPKPIMDEFSTLVEPLFRKMILNQKQIMVLRKVRDVLLPLLVFGKLRVEEL